VSCSRSWTPILCLHPKGPDGSGWDWPALQGLTGMVFSGGELFYSRSGKQRLFWRWFSPESGVAGSAQNVAAGTVNFSSIQDVDAA
jgi:hypothetical protein